MKEHDFDFQGWIEQQADRRMAEDGPQRLDRPLEVSFPDQAMIKTSVSSAWDSNGAPEVVWFSLFARDDAEYRAERRVLVQAIRSHESRLPGLAQPGDHRGERCRGLRE